jgi:hypothetical protein
MQAVLFCLLAIALISIHGYVLGPRTPIVSSALKMGSFVSGVDFNTIAREWRMKWSPENDKKSLASAQQTLMLFKGAIAKIGK